jgi:hypothetical protein
MVKEQTAPEKKPYQKPELKVIDLVAEEVLASGCKGAGAGPLNACVSATPCAGFGS